MLLMLLQQITLMSQKTKKGFGKRSLKVEAGS